MTRWIIEVTRDNDEVLVIVDKDGKFFDDVSFHPSEKDEIMRYLAETLQKIVKEVTGDKEDYIDYVEDCEVADEDTEDIDGSIIEAGECKEVT